MPKTMEHYYQEAGRAGRDGEAAQCILLYSPADIITNKFLIEQGDDQNARQGNYKKLQEIIDYCHTGICLRRYILNYFGEVRAPEKCGNCGNCLNTIEQKVITLEAQKILSCIKRMGERFGSGLTADVLRGAQTVRIRELGFEKLSTYGLMFEYSKPVIIELIAYLAAMGMVDVSGDQYPVLSLNRAAYAWLKSKEDLTIRHLVRLGEAKKGSSGLGRKRKAGLTPLDDLSSDRQVLFEKLRQLRREIAAAQKVPPYVVFSDATLLGMCKTLPTEDSALLLISGVGNVKLEKYALRFLTVIRDHLLGG